MKNKIQYIVKLSSIALFSFVKINLLGFICTFLFFFIGGYFLTKNIQSDPSVRVTAIPFLISFYFENIYGSILFTITFFISPFLFFYVGNKYIFAKLANKLVEDNSAEYIEPVLNNLLDKVKASKDFIVRDGENYSLLKEKLITQLKNENENKWIKKVIHFSLKKVNLDDVDFSDKTLSFKDVLKNKLLQIIHSISKPNRKMIWLVILSQCIVLFIIWLSSR